MSFITGLLLIDAPASALNNRGTERDEMNNNIVAVKAIRVGNQRYPYVSAQAFRYWLRATVERVNDKWRAAPIYREDESVAYTDANPITYWDDDLFGYMRAPKNGAPARKGRKESRDYQALTPLDVDSKDNETAITRLSPFRVSTLVSIAPAQIVQDFESMSRHEGFPVPFSGQFYRATLKGLISLDLHACGTFSYRQRTGYRNLDETRKQLAENEGLTHRDKEKAYRLPHAARIERIAALLEGLANLEGGAKQTLHYTDVAPTVVVLAVTRGGNNIFGHVIGANRSGLPEVQIEALREALTVFKDDLLSDVYVGWVRGYLDEERSKLEAFAKEWAAPQLRISHPREAFQALARELQKSENASWLE